jgi:hypothetical protein
MRPVLVTLLLASFGRVGVFGAPAPVSMDEQLPALSRERLKISTVRRGDLVRRVEAHGAIRNTDGKAIEAVFQVPAQSVADLMVGQPALVAIARQLHPGWVSRISPGEGRDEHAVTVAMEQGPAGMNADEPVVALIETGQLHDVLTVSGVAGNPRSGETVSLFRLEPDSAYATRVKVRVGETAARQIEIWNGLEEGDRVIISRLELPDSVSRVRLR